MTRRSRTSDGPKRPVWKSAAQITSPSARKAATDGTTGKQMVRRPDSELRVQLVGSPASADMVGSEAAETAMPKSETGSV